LFNKVYTHCCCFVVAMPSLKREAERRGKAAANTGPSTNSEGRANSLAEETDEPAGGSGSLQKFYLNGINSLLPSNLCGRYRAVIFTSAKQYTGKSEWMTDERLPLWNVHNVTET
ncbi:hypothetical protein T4B_6527, partial [Trichinella pseudospiralis]